MTCRSEWDGWTNGWGGHDGRPAVDRDGDDQLGDEVVRLSDKPLRVSPDDDLAAVAAGLEFARNWARIQRERQAKARGPRAIVSTCKLKRSRDLSKRQPLPGQMELL